MKNKVQSTISLCMIVKDASFYISKALDSVKNYVDEIIIVDTGSVDDTVKKCRQYTDKLYHYKWADDFSAARNESIKHATKEWIMILDADELFYLEPQNKIKDMLAAVDNTVGGFLCKIYDFDKKTAQDILSNKLDLKKIPVCFHENIRVFRNSPEIYYKYSIHEKITIDKQEVIKGCFNFLHYGYQEDCAKANKVQRNYLCLKKDLDKYPDDLYLRFQLGRYYAGIENLDLMNACFKSLITDYQLFGNKIKFFHLDQVYDFYIKTLLTQDVFLDDATFFCKQWIEMIKQKRLFDLRPTFYLAKIYYKQKKYDEALNLLKIVEKYMVNIESNTYMFSMETLYFLGNIYYLKDDKKTAEDYFKKIIEDKKLAKIFKKDNFS